MLKMRLATPEDAERILEIYTPYVLKTAVTFETEPPDLSEIQRRIRTVSAVYPYLVCELNGRVIAYAYAHRYLERAAYEWSAELSVYVEEAYCQHFSIGTALYTALRDILARQNVQNLYALVSGENKKSIALHKKIGFRKIAVYEQIAYKRNCWHDVVVFQMLLGEHQNPPSALVPLPSLNDGEVEKILRRCQSLLKMNGTVFRRR